MKSRYCYCPMTAKRIGRRVTLLDRIRQHFRRKQAVIDVYPVCGYGNPIYPGK